MAPGKWTSEKSYRGRYKLESKAKNWIKSSSSAKGSMAGINFANAPQLSCVAHTHRLFSIALHRNSLKVHQQTTILAQLMAVITTKFVGLHNLEASYEATIFNHRMHWGASIGQNR